MSKSRVFFIILISFIVGVFVRSFFEIGEKTIFILLVIAVSIFGIFYEKKHNSEPGSCHSEAQPKNPEIFLHQLADQDDKKRNKKAILLAAIILFFAIGLWRTDTVIEKTQNLKYENIEINGYAVVQKATDGTYGQNLVINFKENKIDALAQVPKYPEYNYGELLDASCNLKRIENVDAEFDYRMYMAKEGVLYECQRPRLERTGKNEGNIILSSIHKIGSLLKRNIFTVIPSPEGALAEGLLLGGSGKLTKEIQNDFSRTGMTHIVAVSGYNVTIIAEYLILAGIWIGLWRKQAIIFAIAGIAIFIIMIGFPSSAVRAGVMGSIMLWAIKNGRLSSAENAIILAGAIMLFINPLLLRWDVGFQLSFLAALGIILLSPFWQKFLIKRHKAFGISEAIGTTLSAQLFVLPVIAYNFKITSIISLLANILVLPIIPVSMLLVFMVAISGFFFSGLSLVFAWLAFLPLTYEIKIIHLLASFRWASISIEKIPVYFIFAYYCILMTGIYLLNKNAK